MHVIDVRNVHAALPEGVALLRSTGIPWPTRNGEALVLPGPCTTVYRKPTERVLFYPERDANPFFHFMEGLWLLAGRDDVAYLAKYVKRIETFSDDGVTLRGSYGRRWLYPYDQLETIIRLLTDYPRSRRAVLSMWRDEIDLCADEHMKDVPCNLNILFWRAEGEDRERLHMTVTCRSNDIIWGAYGANAVHFSMLQEYMAARLGCDVGYYWQVSNNYHAYTDVLRKVGRTPRGLNYYVQGLVEPYPMVADPTTWMQCLEEFFTCSGGTLTNPFFTDVAYPIREAHRAYKQGDMDLALEIIADCSAADWRVACTEWLKRRAK